MALYWYSTGSTDWTALVSWWDDPEHTSAADHYPYQGEACYLLGAVAPILDAALVDRFPAIIDTTGLTDGARFEITQSQQIPGSFSVVITGPLTVSGIYVLLGTVTGDAIFNDTSLNQADLTGDATFNDDAQNCGQIHGTATFNGNSKNSIVNWFMGYVDRAVFNDNSVNFAQSGVQAVVFEDATFNGNSRNLGQVSGIATFNGNAQNAADGLGWSGYAVQAVFYDDSVNNGYVAGDAVFHDRSYIAAPDYDLGINGGGVAGNATFHDDSYNDGTVWGDATFAYAVGGVVTVAGTRVFGSINGAVRDGNGDPLLRVVFTETSSLQGDLGCSAEFRDGAFLYWGSVVGDVTYVGQVLPSGGWIGGNVIWNRIVGGLATFQGTEELQFPWVDGTIQGLDGLSARRFVFHDQSVMGDAFCPDSVDLEFNDASALNASSANSHITLNDQSTLGAFPNLIDNRGGSASAPGRGQGLWF